MKKITLFVIVIGLMAITSVLVAGDKDYPQFKFGGRIAIELVSENNMNDFTDYDYGDLDDDSTTPDESEGNDVTSYGRSRVDLNFKTMISENTCAVINTRFESATGNKWMTYGKNGPDRLQDSEPKLQEAYIGFRKIFTEHVNGEIGRKVYKYGSGMVMSDKDKVDGWRLGGKFGKGYLNMHYIIRTYNEDNLANVDEPNQQWIWGINGGADKLIDMIDFNAYYWLQYEPEHSPDKADESVAKMMNIFGARGEADIMDGMLTPFMEFAFQFGVYEKGYVNESNELEDYVFSGYLFDIGTGFEKEIGDMAIDANVEFLMLSGDDVNTNDENEGWQGIGLGNRELGYMEYNVALPVFEGTDDNGDDVELHRGLTMFALGGGITPIDPLRIGLDFYMFNDNSSNAEATKDNKDVEISGENIWNEIDLSVDYKIDKKVTLYVLWGIVLPNGDYPYELDDGEFSFGEDMATGFTFGAQVKW